MDTWSERRVRLRRLWSPWISAALVLALLVDAIAVGVAELPRRRGYHPPRLPIVRSADGPRLALDDEEVAIDGWIYCFNLRRTVGGVWAGTSRWINHSLFVSMNDGTFLSTEEADHLRALYADEIARRWGDNEVATLVRAGDGFTSRPILAGYIHNAVAILVACGLVWSLWWVGVMRREARRKQARAAGRCPGCGFDLRGLPMGTCPECG
jgi:hypothetical protein